MIQSEHILEYIDGQLDPESEQDLFDALARQPELRSTLRQFVCISEAVHADREAYAPPADVERGLMSALGITAADLGFATGTSGFMARLGAVIVGRAWGMVDAFVIGVIATGLLFYAGGSKDRNASQPIAGAVPAATPSNAIQPNASQPNMSQPNALQQRAPALNAASAMTPASVPAPSMRMNVPRPMHMLSSRRIHTSVTPVDRHGDVAARDGATTVSMSDASQRDAHNAPTVPAEASSTMQSGTMQSSTMQPPISMLHVRDIPRTIAPVATGSSDPLAVPDGLSRFMHTTSPLEDALLNNPDSASRFVTEMRGQLGWSLNATKARAAASGSGREAYAAGIYIRFSDGVGLGIEGGRESFDQILRYHGGDTLEIDQRPQFIWGGVGVRYELPRFALGAAMPFMQATFGATTYGPLLRYRLGAQYDFGGGFGATLSGEIASLMYEFDNQRMVSGRVGVSAGMTYTIR